MNHVYQAMDRGIVFFKYSVETYFRKRSPPLRQPCPVGGGGAYDASGLPVKNSAFLGTDNTALSQPGRLSGGAKPLERHVIPNDFYRAKRVQIFPGFDRNW
jgi:hypothetical protein